MLAPYDYFSQTQEKEPRNDDGSHMGLGMQQCHKIDVPQRNTANQGHETGENGSHKATTHAEHPKRADMSDERRRL